MTDPTPTTEAGRAYVDKVSPLSESGSDAHRRAAIGRRAGTVRDILAIEAEARADSDVNMAHAYTTGTKDGAEHALREAAERVRALPRIAMVGDINARAMSDDPDGPYVNRVAILSILETE